MSNSNSSPSSIEILLGVVAFMVFLAYVIHLIMTMYTLDPVVYKSWSLQACTCVKSSNIEHSCDNLPDRYYLVWVK